ncbi:MAG: RNA methyltransferase [Candidatus Magasanikbacteria bacterium]
MLPKEVSKHIKKLHQKKFRHEFQEFLVEGVKGVYESLIADTEVMAIIVEEKRKDELDFSDIISKAKKQDVDVFFCAHGDIGEIKTTDTYPGVQAIVTTPDTYLAGIQNSSPILCLDGIQDPGNLGTMIRTADWFGIPNILLSENSVDPYNPKTVRSTMGSLFHVSIVESKDIIIDLEKLKEKNYSVFSLSTEGRPLDKEKLVKHESVYIFGSESHGVRKDLVDMSDELYSIPGKGRAESLNVGVAAGIILSYL